MSYPNYPNYPNQQAAPVARKKKVNIWIIIAIIVALLFCCCITIGVGGYFAYSNGMLNGTIFDSIIGTLFGGRADPLAKVLPEDSQGYVSVDFLKLVVNKDYDDIINAFARHSGDPDINNKEELIKKMDESLDDAWGVTLTDDIMPWIGTYMGASFWDVSSGYSYSSSTSSTFVFAIEARDQAKADEFVQKVISHLEDQNSTDTDEQEYQGVKIYVNGETNVFARSGGILYIGNDSSKIEAAIDAQKGTSLSQNEEYKNTIASLPQDRVITMYLSPDVLKDLQSSSSSSIPTIDYGKGVALAVSSFDKGLKVDYVSMIDSSNLSPEVKAMLEAGSGADSNLTKFFSSDTILFAGGNKFNLGWEYAQKLLEDSLGSSSDLEESMSMVEEQIGFNPMSDLFPIMDGSYAIGVTNDNDSILNMAANVPLGFQAIFQTSKPDEMNTVVNNFVDALGNQPGVNTDENTGDGFSYYSIEAGELTGSAGPILSVGFKEPYLLLATNSDMLNTFDKQGDSLANNDKFKEAWDALPGNMKPSIYVDFASMKGLIEDMGGTDLEPLTPLDRLVMGSKLVNGDLSTTTILIFINKD